MLNVITFLWGTKYNASHVNRLARLVRTYYPAPHRFLCITDDPRGIECETRPGFGDFIGVPSPHGPAFPACYRRLRLFHPDAAQWFGDRFVSLDLDWTIHADLRPLWGRPEPFVALRDPLYGHRGQYCGAMLMLTAGAMPQVWERFRPDGGPRVARARGFRGSDQAWISYAAPGAPTWTTADGVYSYKVDCRKGLPAGARMVNFHGQSKPWTCGQLWAA